MVDHPLESSLRASWLAAVLVIAATYFYFLIFAEFAFLELARHIAPTTSGLRRLMLALGAGGVVGAVAVAWQCRGVSARALLTWTLRGCALSALFAVVATTPATLWAAGFMVGLSLGALTVTLAASLRAATINRRLGLCVGAGTGMAYALSNAPFLFHATPASQTIFAAIVTGTASFLPRLMSVELKPDKSPELPRWELARWIGVLLALVWMDSAAFYIVQHSASLRAVTWQTNTSLAGNAGIHLFTAIAAGALLDRGWRHPVIAVAVIALTAACLTLNGTLPLDLPAAWFYTAGVSLYSTVLVEYPARTGRRWIAAAVFAIAGWIGSAAGIGMAQDLARIPTGLVVAALAFVILALSWRRRYATALALLLLLPAARELRGDEISLGREVYIAEGCIHCHSQYIRPRSEADVQLWGPATPLQQALSAAPPLFGTRRQGPDLSHVGNRRSPEWNRLHLIAPQTVSPGSRMPSYKYLFSGDDGRGEALVAYLASLGAGSIDERRDQAARWSPKADAVIAPERAKELYAQSCAQCHGAEGRGNGPLAPKLIVRPPDWSQSEWRHVKVDAAVEHTLCRIIKFGLPGLAMAGHEYLPDNEIVGLARFVETLHKGSGRASHATNQP